VQELIIEKTKTVTMRKTLFIFIYLFTATAVFAQEIDKQSEEPEYENMTVAQFKKRTEITQKLVYVNFKADWCIVCKRQAPAIEQFKKENKNLVEVIVLDMEKNPLIAEYFEVDGLPINLLYKNGTLVWDRIGLQTYLQLKEALEKYRH